MFFFNNKIANLNYNILDNENDIIFEGNNYFSDKENGYNINLDNLQI